MNGNQKIKHCKKCLMPNTRPGSVFDDNGVCGACRSYEKRKTVNWEKRREELNRLCDKYRRQDGYYDCIVPVSGGKDSHFQLYTMKEEMKMNPLLITVGDPYTKTQAGLHNFKNLGDTFNCDHIMFYLSTDLLRRVTRITFEKFANPLLFVEVAAYTFTFKMALKLGIPLIIFGEDPEYEYGRTEKTDTDSGNRYILEGQSQGFKTLDIDFWLRNGVSKKELNVFIPPTKEELERTKPEVIFLGYFIPWSSTEHLEIAKRYGFRDLTHEWKREGYIEDFEQIDSVGYMINFWLKYPKFGFQRVTDIASRRVREGKISLVEAKKLIMEHDHKLDRRIMDDFINFIEYTPRQFWDVVERFWNRNLFEKVNDVWRPKFNYDG